MFSQLIGSQPARTQGAEGTTASLVLHGLIITAALIATAQSPAVLEAPRESRIVALTAPMVPQPTATPARAAAPRAPVTSVPPVAPTVVTEVPPLVAPTEIPSAIPAPTEGATPVLYPEGSTPSLPGTGDPTTGSPIGTGNVRGAESVDVAARLLPHSPLPQYPGLLRTRGLEGNARVRFVVSATGRAELATLEVLDATHPAFAEAVRAVLPRLRFAPAKVGREHVRQLVEIPFGFTLAPRRS